MTLPEILGNEELRRAEFPAVARGIFMGHAGVCPLPRRVQLAINYYLAACTEGDQEEALPSRFFPELRASAATLLKATPEEIALVGPTTLALSFVAEGLRFRKKGNVLVYQDDYPSNVYPWMTLVHRGMEVRLLNIRQFGIVRTRDILGQIDENTRLVALASCHYISGCRLDLAEIGAELRQRGILFCVDGIQTLGAFPTTVEHVDFLAADAHKWLLGPCGSGLLYVRKELQKDLRPLVHGWHNINCPNFIAQDDLEYKQDARRYEGGTHSLPGLVGLKASLELLLELGIDNIAAELLRKRAFIAGQLRAKGYSILNDPSEPRHQGGMLSCFKPGFDLAPLHTRLAQERITLSLRFDRTGQKYLRFSPHFYNTDAEIERVLSFF